MGTSKSRAHGTTYAKFRGNSRRRNSAGMGCVWWSGEEVLIFVVNFALIFVCMYGLLMDSGTNMKNYKNLADGLIIFAIIVWLITDELIVSNVHNCGNYSVKWLYTLETSQISVFTDWLVLLNGIQLDWLIVTIDRCICTTNQPKSP